MRILNISSHMVGFGLIVNYGIDYHRAGAASFYDLIFVEFLSS